MNKEIELLAPGGDVDAIKAAILAGADAVYFGLDQFNARNRAVNVRFEELCPLLSLAHQHHCKLFLTLNIVIIETEIPALFRLLNRIAKTDVDGVIVQDIGLLYVLQQYFPALEVHASTQMTTHNIGQIKFLHALGASRSNLSRELALDEIKELTDFSHKLDMGTEVFVHGSNCISFSGLCYFSSVHGGQSGNRGRCSQPCRDAYVPTKMEKHFPLNMKDNSAYFQMADLIGAGVDSLKVEGRIKKPHYVYSVVNTWRKQLDRFAQGETLLDESADLYRVFNRDFTHGYLSSDINKQMYIDNPRDHANSHFIERNGATTEMQVNRIKQRLYDEKTEILELLENKTANWVLKKIPLKFKLICSDERQLSIQVISSEKQFELPINYGSASAQSTLCLSSLEKRLQSFNTDKYQLLDIEYKGDFTGVSLSYKNITTLKQAIAQRLDSKALVQEDVTPPKIAIKNTKATTPVHPGKTATSMKLRPRLSVLLNSAKDINKSQGADLCYFQIPESIGEQFASLVQLLNDNPSLIPWFPPVLIGKDFDLAIRLLLQVKPKQLVSNNLGIAQYAYEQGIEWIAGPYLNLCNSLALEALKQTLDCKGAFVSPELSLRQTKSIQCPAEFELHYSAFHPSMLMSSRQCFFHQVTGCKKDKIDAQCLPDCQKHAQIINLKDASFVLDKQKGHHNCIYDSQHFLNLNVAQDMPGKFSNVLLDLRRIKTSTQLNVPIPELIQATQDLLDGDTNKLQSLEQHIAPTMAKSYRKGI